VHVSRKSGRRLVAAVATLVTATSLLITGPGPAGAAPTPPPNPTNGQLSAARSAQDAQAAKVGLLSGQIAAQQNQIQQLKNKSELAEQKYAYAYSLLQQAQQAAQQAQADVKAARTNIDAAHAKFVEYVQATYMSGEVDGTAGSLLTASDPSALLEQSALAQFQQQHQVDAIGTLQRATVAKSNADAKARLTARNRTQAAAAADSQRKIAFAAVASAKTQEAALQQSMAAHQQELDAAQKHLADLNGQRAAYNAYLVEQARIAAEKARKAKLAREAAARAAAAQQAALAAARARANHSSGGGGGGGGSVSFSPGPSAPTGGGWTAAKGRKAANRALSTLGTPYAWAGGGVSGPSYGVCDASNGAPNDCNVLGYDCSGLAMYAWGRNWAHFAATQYTQAGSYHPGPGNLRAGDLIFWSSNGRISGIHHVAIAIGGGQMVEAPFSGGFVQVASVYEYGSFFGATRPLT
jgi:cell wall-associated NlpC family hydrolase